MDFSLTLKCFWLSGKSKLSSAKKLTHTQLVTFQETLSYKTKVKTREGDLHVCIS